MNARAATHMAQEDELHGVEPGRRHMGVEAPVAEAEAAAALGTERDEVLVLSHLSRQLSRTAACQQTCRRRLLAS